ncbi:unnamed protein product [Closterium sp. NIES-53]
MSADSMGRFRLSKAMAPSQGRGGKQIHVPDVLYVPAVQANLLSVGHLKDSGMKMQDYNNEMLLVLVAGDVLGCARYTDQVLCTDLFPCSTKSTSTLMETVALRTIASATKSSPHMWHARLAHIGVEMIKISAVHGVAASLNIKPTSRANLPCVSCVGRHRSSRFSPSGQRSPPSVGGECALGTDVLEDRQEDFECLADAVPRFASMLLAREGDLDAPDIPTPRSYAEAITGPYSSQWQAAMDAEMASWKPIGTYVDAVPPSWANIVDGMWIFRVKRMNDV